MDMSLEFDDLFVAKLFVCLIRGRFSGCIVYPPVWPIFDYYYWLKKPSGTLCMSNYDMICVNVQYIELGNNAFILGHNCSGVPNKQTCRLHIKKNPTYISFPSFSHFKFQKRSHSSGPNNSVVLNKHGGWTITPKLINMWSGINVWLNFQI